MLHSWSYTYSTIETNILGSKREASLCKELTGGRVRISYSSARGTIALIRHTFISAMPDCSNAVGGRLTEFAMEITRRNPNAHEGYSFNVTVN